MRKVPFGVTTQHAEQFAEGMSHSDLLKHHGWSQAIGGGWTHPNHKGSVILADSKDWLHSPSSPNKKAVKGVGNDSLAMHLTHLDYKTKNK